MNLAKIDAATVPENRSFLKAAVKRLAKVFSDSLTSDDAEVLAFVLQLYTITFVDDFVLNGDDSLSMIGRSDAAMILSALCDETNDTWEQWRTRISSSKLSPEVLSERFERILGRLLGHKSVRALNK